MSLFTKIPIDIVKHILTYDKRFVIQNGNIIVIHKLDRKILKCHVLVTH